jgi:hypothetical protein
MVKFKLAAEHWVVHSGTILASEPMLRGAVVVLPLTTGALARKPRLVNLAFAVLMRVEEPHHEP